MANILARLYVGCSAFIASRARISPVLRSQRIDSASRGKVLAGRSYDARMGSAPASIVADVLFDGERFHQGPVSVDVSGGRITAVRPLRAGGPLPEGAVDAREHALLPGLIDAHCHAA